jgi:two-component system cell cycle response regulator DivK
MATSRMAPSRKREARIEIPGITAIFNFAVSSSTLTIEAGDRAAKAFRDWAHHRDARGQDLGRVAAWSRLHVCLHASDHRRAASGGGMSKRILVVEDQADNRQIIRDMLAPTDYESTEVENGEQALAAVAKQRPDLILMGIQLSIMDGYTVTRQIKADPALRSIPIIAVTSHALNGEERTARAAGCDDYVPEPYSPRQLLAKIRQYMPK